MRTFLMSITLLLTSATGMAQAPAKPATSPCVDPEYHQFDFWAGRWDVYDPAGKLIAHSLIEPVYGCGIRENWMPIGKAGRWQPQHLCPRGQALGTILDRFQRFARVFHRRLERHPRW